MDENNNGSADISRKNRSKKISLVLIIIVIVCGFFLLNHKSINNDYGKRSGDTEGLKKRLSEILELENNRDFGKIYDNYFSPETKTRLNRDAYIKEASSNFENRIYSSKIAINDVKIDGDVGYVDRTREDCLDENCATKKQTRSYKKYVFVDNDWRMVVDDKPIYCVRNAGYEMPEEFKRALSLIIQRYEQSDSASVQRSGAAIRDIQNCLNIQYATSGDSLSGAEGVFVFVPAQSLNKLDIFVSPKYAAKDDLLTSALLIHEIYHVFDFVNGEFSGEPVGCFETEAKAFSNQNFFISHVLNSEEIKSINSRIYTNSSEEARQLGYVFNAIPKMKGADYQEKALNFVKSSPAYQKQCKENEQKN